MSRNDADDGESRESFPSDDLERDIQGLANSWDAAFAPAVSVANASRNQDTLDWAPGWPPSAPRELTSFPALATLANDQDEPAAGLADAAGPQFLDFDAAPEAVAASPPRKRRPGLLFTAIAFLLSIAGLAYTIVNLPAPLDASRGRSASREIMRPEVQQALPSSSPGAGPADALHSDEAAASAPVPSMPPQGGDAAAKPAGQHNSEPFEKPEPRLKLDNVPETEASGRGTAGPHAHAAPGKASANRVTAEPSRFATTGVRERSIEAEAMSAMFGPGSTSVVVTGATALSLSGTAVRPPVEDLPAAIGSQALRLAAVAGDPSAEFEIGVRFAQGQGVQQNFPNALHWYERAAGRGLAIAQYRLGTLYEIGLGVAADAAKARDLYREAASQGSVKAMHDLSALNVREGADVASWSEALYWLKQAAGYGLAESQLSLGALYESGDGVTKDAKLAYVWFALAARSGEKAATTGRDRVLRQLSAEDARDARELIAAFRPKSVLALTNDARVAGDAWKTRQASATRGPG